MQKKSSYGPHCPADRAISVVPNGNDSTHDGKRNQKASSACHVRCKFRLATIACDRSGTKSCPYVPIAHRKNFQIMLPTGNTYKSVPVQAVSRSEVKICVFLNMNFACLNFMDETNLFSDGYKAKFRSLFDVLRANHELYTSKKAYGLCCFTSYPRKKFL